MNAVRLGTGTEHQRIAEARDALKWYSNTCNQSVSPINEVPGGDINATWFVESPPKYVLQKVSSIIPKQANVVFYNVAKILREHKIICPQIIHTDDGEIFKIDSFGACWRLIEYIPGRAVPFFSTEEELWSAGRLIGDFHRVANESIPVEVIPDGWLHNTEWELSKLKNILQRSIIDTSLQECGSDIMKVWSMVRQFASRIGDAKMNCHGDLRTGNILLHTENNKAFGIIDFDTLGRYHFAVEMGDAMRDWTNSVGENVEEAEFSFDRLKIAMDGYRAGVDRFKTVDMSVLACGMVRIACEKAARLCSDAVEDSVFRWNKLKFANGRTHKLVRARNQISFAKQVYARREDIASELF